MRHRPHNTPVTDAITVSVAQFCKLSGLGKTKTYSLIKKGDLSVARIGRRTLIRMDSAHALLNPQSIHSSESENDGSAVEAGGHK